MKRIITIALTLLYLMPAIGINGTAHYCGEEIASITINGLGSSEKCGCGSERMKKNCCHDEIFSFQLEDDHCKTPLFLFNIERSLDFFPAIITPIYFYFNASFFHEEVYYSHSPPDNVRIHSYIMHQVFRV